MDGLMDWIKGWIDWWMGWWIGLLMDLLMDLYIYSTTKHEILQISNHNLQFMDGLMNGLMEGWMMDWWMMDDWWIGWLIDGLVDWMFVIIDGLIEDWLINWFIIFLLSRDCQEDLCESCVIAHQRVKLTREHAIFHYPDTPNPNRIQAAFTSHQTTDSDVIRLNWSEFRIFLLWISGLSIDLQLMQTYRFVLLLYDIPGGSYPEGISNFNWEI